MRCVIYYVEDGVKKEWPVDAHPTLDNARTLAKHLKKWRSKAKFLGFKFDEGREKQ